jgi:hypothetical protein
MSWRMLVSWRDWRTPHVVFLYIGLYLLGVVLVFALWTSAPAAAIFLPAAVAFLIVCAVEARYRSRDRDPAD